MLPPFSLVTCPAMQKRSKRFRDRSQFEGLQNAMPFSPLKNVSSRGRCSLRRCFLRRFSLRRCSLRRCPLQSQRTASRHVTRDSGAVREDDQPLGLHNINRCSCCCGARGVGIGVINCIAVVSAIVVTAATLMPPLQSGPARFF